MRGAGKGMVDTATYCQTLKGSWKRSRSEVSYIAQPSIPLPMAGIANQSQYSLSLNPEAISESFSIHTTTSQSELAHNLESVVIHALSQPSHYVQEKIKAQREVEFAQGRPEGQVSIKTGTMSLGPYSRVSTRC